MIKSSLLDTMYQNSVVSYRLPTQTTDMRSDIKKKRRKDTRLTGIGGMQFGKKKKEVKERQMQSWSHKVDL